jgi:hypothetical protein
MDEKLDTWVAAEYLIAEYGDAAERQARQRVRASVAEGEHSAAATWELIREAIKDLRNITCDRP